jgi:DnaJ-class molecular chaperone
MDTREKETLYTKLGVLPSASSEEIHHAYAELTQRFLSKDGDGATDETAVSEDERLFQELTQAYRTLVDEESRRNYDCSLEESEATLVVHQEQQPDHVMARYQEVILSGHAPSEEWAKEREYFEEHFDEILKPAPKVNLIATGLEAVGIAPTADNANTNSAPSAHSDADRVESEGEVSDVDATVKFGTFPSDRELAAFVVPKNPRRPASMGGPIDPLDLLLYLGAPLFAIILLLEYYFLMM